MAAGEADGAGETPEKRGDKADNAVENPDKTGKNRKRAARDMSRSDWLLIQHAVAVEGTSCAAAQRAFGVEESSIRARAKKERWRDPDVIRAMPTIEEIIIMRNEREILRALKSMSGQLEDALQSKTGDDATLALKKMEMVGKAARSAQSVARAAEVSSSNKRRVKANDRAASDGTADRAAIKAELDRLAAKAPKGPVD